MSSRTNDLDHGGDDAYDEMAPVACPFAKADPRRFPPTEMCGFRRPMKNMLQLTRAHTIRAHEAHNRELIEKRHPDALDPQLFQVMHKRVNRPGYWGRGHCSRRWFAMYDIIAKWLKVERPVDLHPGWTLEWYRKALVVQYQHFIPFKQVKLNTNPSSQIVSIYCASWSLWPDYVMIGSQHMDPELQQCFPEIRPEACFHFNFHEIILQFIYKELQEYRCQLQYPKCPGCEGTHTNWFHVQPSTAIDILSRWWQIVQKRPLHDSKGELASEWIVMSENEIISSKDLLEALSKEDTIRQTGESEVATTSESGALHVAEAVGVVSTHEADTGARSANYVEDSIQDVDVLNDDGWLIIT